MSNSFSALNEEEEEVENVCDESANLILNTKAGGSSSFTAAAVAIGVAELNVTKDNTLLHAGEDENTWGKNGRHNARVNIYGRLVDICPWIYLVPDGFNNLEELELFFPWGLSVTNLDVIGVIEDEETFRKLCDQDSIRLCLILALEVIFMGRLLTCPVDDTLFRLVENLEDWNCFPWGEHIWTHLYDEIKNVIEKHSDEHYFGMKKDRMYVPTYTLSGFVFAFQVWIFESFERCNCWWIKDPKVIPRALGWSKKSIFKRSDCCYLFAKESTTTTDIRPTIAEYESSWWICSHVFFRQTRSKGYSHRIS
ncbi:hypothetical protein Tco_0934185 [Tanacetum coccineum]